MGKTFSLIEYIRRQAGMLAWRAFAMCFFAALYFMGPAMLNRLLANSEFAKDTSAAIAEATVTSRDASANALDAIAKTNQVIKVQDEMKVTSDKIFAELRAQREAQGTLAQSVAVIGEDVKAIQGQLSRDETIVDRSR